jgi:acetyl-CoA C-acetyltransferase
MSQSVFIAGYARTPFVKFAGVFQQLSAVDLGAIAAKAAMERSGVSPDQVDFVIGGQVLQALSGQNPARQTAIKAGLSHNTPAITLNSVCLSGTEAVSQATRLISSGEREVVLVVGQESMSQAPHAAKLRAGNKYGSMELLDTVEADGLSDAFECVSMGLLTDNENSRLSLTRESQDAWSARSHKAAVTNAEFLAGEIVPVEIPKLGTISADNGVRPETTAESLAGLRAAFSTNGTITAGNSSQITDGAAAMVLVSADAAKRLGLHPIAEVLSFSHVAGPDVTLQAQPARAILAALEKIDLPVSELKSVEINEAFAAVVIQSVQMLGISEEIVNPHSGAIALGHPVGASGARIVGHLARTLQQLGSGSVGAAGICGGGGQGAAVVLRAV